MSAQASTSQSRSKRSASASDGEYALSTSTGNVQKRQKRASDEFKDLQKQQRLDRLRANTETLRAVDPERGVHAAYKVARSKIPSDEKLQSTSYEDLQALTLATVQAFEQAYDLEQSGSSAFGLRCILALPHTMRAFLSYAKSPLTFNASKWPEALQKADTRLIKASDPLTSSTPDDKVAAAQQNFANFYTRFYPEGSETAYSAHVNDFGLQHPSYTVRAEAMLLELRDLPSTAIIASTYTGYTIAYTPPERCQQDFAGIGRMVCNWIKMDQYKQAMQSGCKVFEWLELRKLVDDRYAARLIGDVANIEFYLVLAAKPLSLNSAHGGHGLLNYLQAPKLQQIRREHPAFQPAQNLPSFLPPAVQTTQDNLRNDIRKHYRFMKQVFEHLGEELCGPDMPLSSFDIVMELAAAVDLQASGHLKECILIGKDITNESFNGGPLTCYRGQRTGSGPRLEHYYRQKTLGLELPLMGGTFDMQTALLYGPYLDLWCIILRHRCEILIIVVLFLSRYLLLFRKHGVPVPFMVVQSSKVCNLFLSGRLASCWKPDITPAELEAFLDEPTIPLLLNVMRGNLPDLSIESLEASMKAWGIVIWDEVEMKNWSSKIGSLVRVNIGPLAPQQALRFWQR